MTGCSPRRNPAERQSEGIAAARRHQAEGRMLPGKKHIGRPKVTGPAESAAFRRLTDDGASVTQAARTLKISRSTAYAAVAGGRRPDRRPRRPAAAAR